MTRPRMVRRVNGNYNPWEVKQEFYVRCSVCGWAGIDLNLYSQGSDIAPISFEIDAESGRAVSVIAAFAACPFCASPRFDGGSAPDLRW